MKKILAENNIQLSKDNQEEFNWVGGVDCRRKLLSAWTKLLDEAKEFFMIVVDGIQIPWLCEDDYTEFFGKLIARQDLKRFFFTSDNIVEGERIFNSFKKEAEESGVIVLVDAKFRPSYVSSCVVWMAISDPSSPKQFAANENRIIYLKP